MDDQNKREELIKAIMDRNNNDSSNDQQNVMSLA